MPLLIGVDEAGYGPLLGPLVVGASVWRVAAAGDPPDLWSALREAIARAPRRGDWRFLVDDSKAAYQRETGLGALERTVLGFARAVGLQTTSLDVLLARLNDESLTSGGMPWHAGAPIDLPVAARGFDGASERLARVMRTVGVECTALLCQVVDEVQFNARVHATRNKAALLIEQVLRVLGRALRDVAQDDAYVFVDRLGGRSDYRALLQLAYPQRSLHVLEATPDRSRYALRDGRTCWTFSFSVEADAQHAPVALASMLAKYVREALMLRFNAYWREHMPALRPTAGYYQDAQRFLADIAPLLPQVGLAAEQFVRAR